MVQWVIKASADCPVYRYVIHVLEEEMTPEEPNIRRWLVESSEGQIQQFMRENEYVSVTWWDTWNPGDVARKA